MEIKEAWGVIRPGDDGQWYLLNDEYHKSSGIKKVSQTEEYVQIDYDFEKLKMVHWTAVTPDETMIKHNILVGASARLDCARIYFAEMGEAIVPEDIKLGDKANFWFYAKGE